MDLHAWITAQVAQVERLIDEGEWPPSQADGMQFRCESDRRLLALHCRSDSRFSVGCEGCGYDGGYCPELIVDTLNDCPVLLALAHAHGITPEILAGLDKPTVPEREPSSSGILSGPIADIWGAQLDANLRATLIRDVPPALRGPNWKADQA